MTDRIVILSALLGWALLAGCVFLAVAVVTALVLLMIGDE